MRRVLSIFLILGVILSFTTFVGRADEVPDSDAQTKSGEVGNDYVKVYEVNGRELWVDIVSCDVFVRDMYTGLDWHTAPQGLEADSSVSSTMMKQLQSQLIVTYLNAGLNEVTVGSRSCIEKDTYQISKVNGGVKITYIFDTSETGFVIPIELTLNKDFLQAKILYEDIEENGKSRITNIDLLPWFCAGSSAEDGYLFIPDGSGALVRFSDNIRDAAAWRKTVYGDDPAVNLMINAPTPEETVCMPVFGIKKANGALFAVIHEGDAASEIFANNHSGNAPLAAVGCSFIYHQKDLTGIRDKSSNLRMVTMMQKAPLNITPTVRYYFLDADNADYSGMARCYRQYLEKNKKMNKQTQKDSAPVGLQFYGLTQKPSNFLGIPISKKVTATTFQDVSEYLGVLDVNNPLVFLYGFEKGGYENKYPSKMSFDRRVGGQKGYGDLIESTNGSVYHVADLLRDYSNRLFGGTYIESLNKLTIKRRQPKLNTGDWDYDASAWKYNSLSALEKSLNKYLKSMPTNNGGNLLLRRLGSEVISDFSSKTSTDRTQAVETYIRLLEQAKETTNVATDGGNAYAAPYVTLFNGVPTKSSHPSIAYEDVPFYAMVFHGYVSLASKPLNNMAEWQTDRLSMIATGVTPVFTLTGIEASELKMTGISFCYNTSMENWTEEIKETASICEQVQKSIGNTPIYSHDRTGTLEIVTYENGTVVVANTGETSVSYGGSTIHAKTVSIIS